MNKILGRLPVDLHTGFHAAYQYHSNLQQQYFSFYENYWNEGTLSIGYGQHVLCADHESRSNKLAASLFKPTKINVRSCWNLLLVHQKIAVFYVSFFNSTMDKGFEDDILFL